MFSRDKLRMESPKVRAPCNTPKNMSMRATFTMGNPKATA